MTVRQALLCFLLLCSNCAAQGFQSEVEAFPSEVQLAVANGEPDLRDRYPTTVMVASDQTPGFSDKPGYCSGVLIEPGLVLSAAHCMCLPAIHSARDQVIDRSSCSKSARVIRPTYEFEDEKNKAASEKPSRRLAGVKYPEIQGTVFLPEEFKVGVDARGVIKSRIADFAIIRLQQPVAIRMDYQFPDREVAVGESITVVGFGNLQQHDMSAATFRYFGANTVTGVRLFEDEDSPSRDKERVEIYFHRKKSGAHIEQGDSGGPCFREDKQGRWLVGIAHSNVPDGRTSVLLSTFHSRGLIDKLILRARAKTD